MRIWLWLTTAIVTKEWVACHRKHHAFADREGDPHTPLIEGLRNIILKGAFYYRKTVRQPGMLEKYGKGTPNDWIERHPARAVSWLGIVIMLASTSICSASSSARSSGACRCSGFRSGPPASSTASVTRWAIATTT